MTRWADVGAWVIARAREPSTWRGVVWLLTAAGMHLDPDQAAAIMTAGATLAGTLAVFTRETPK